MNLKQLIGKIWGVYCPKCGEKLTPQGYYGDVTWCKECEAVDEFYGESEAEHDWPIIRERTIKLAKYLNTKSGKSKISSTQKGKFKYKIQK